MRPRTLIASTLAAVTLAVLVPSLATAKPIAATDVVVNVTLGANDPVQGATVVARDDLTGRVVSRTTTTGSLGYAVVRMLPMPSNRRITITATGGTSGAVGRLSRTDDALGATVQRAAADAAIEVNVNPATTIQAAYLDLRPRATLAASERTVARRLRVAPGMPLDEAGRFSRLRFSGEAFARVARGRGGITRYADWAASRVAARIALPDFAAPVPSDDLPLRGAAPRRQNDVGAGTVAWSLVVKPLVEFGGKLLLCKVGVKFLCSKDDAPGQLSPEDKQQLKNIEQGISNLQTQITQAQQAVSAIEKQVAALQQSTAYLSYSREMDAVRDVMQNSRALAGKLLQGAEPNAADRLTLTNSLERLHAINVGCPNWRALIGSLPPNVVSQYPDEKVACVGGSAGLGVMQFAQRFMAAEKGFVATDQAEVDRAGEYWLGEFEANVAASYLAQDHAQATGKSTRTPEVANETAQLFMDAIATVANDATGAYFGVRIPSNQVLAMGATQGTIYGIGTYREPGACRGEALWMVQHRIFPVLLRLMNQTWDSADRSSYLPGGAVPLDRNRRACTGAELIAPPPPVPGAPSTQGWQPAKEIRADHLRDGIRDPLRAAALCHVRDRLVAAGKQPPAFSGDGSICVPRPSSNTGIPDQVRVQFPGPRRPFQFILPNLQLSLDHGMCAPWEIGTQMSNVQRKTDPHDLVTAVGMQCPVTDLTPRAHQQTGWNCVSANPSGKVATGFLSQSGVGGSFDFEEVKSSLGGRLDVRSMGGYCPSWGGLRGPSGTNNFHVEAGRVFCSPGLELPNPFYPERLACRPGPLPRLINRLTSYFEPSDPTGLGQQAPALPTGARLNDLTSVGINVGAQNWTYNNDVAGDFVVGPLFISDAVGAYVPGTSPGGPVPSGATPPRLATRPPGPPRDLTGECGEPCTGPTGEIRVQWRPPHEAGGFGIRGYEVRARGVNANQDVPGATCTTRATECTIRGLGDREQITIRVWARTAVGAGDSTSVLFEGLGLPRPRLRPVLRGLEVRWDPPAPGAPTPMYTATASPGGGSCTASAREGSCTITGLRPDERYTVTIAANTRTITSRPSAPATPGVEARPGAPTLVTGEAHPGRIRIAWSRPESDGFSRIAGYTATAQPGGATCTSLDRLACDIDGLANGVGYTVTVTATNGVGTGPPSAETRQSTPVLVPSAPRTPLVRESLTRIEVQWSAPESDGGRPITAYTATASPGGATCTTTGAKGCTIEGLSSGTGYEVTVTATNEAGTGPSSEPASAVTAAMTVPGAPDRPSVDALPGGVRVTWSVPDVDGGTEITGYVATATPGGTQCETTGATTCVIRGLENGTAYRVGVAAVNVTGTGPSSEASVPVTPRRHADVVPRQADEFDLQPVAVPGTAAPVPPAGGPEASEPVVPGSGPALVLADVALTPRTLVPGLGGRIAYSLSESANVTITFARVGARDRQSRVVHRIPAGRPGALAGDTRIRVLYSRTSPRRKVAGAWTMTIEARDAQGRVARRIIPIRVRS